MSAALVLGAMLSGLVALLYFLEGNVPAGLWALVTGVTQLALACAHRVIDTLRRGRR